jgi:hypothetical protein
MKKIVRGYWDCPYCGTKHIDGLVDDCPNCGKHKSAGTKYYIDRSSLDQDVLTDEQLNAANMPRSERDGNHRDWTCRYCSQTNNWRDETCVQCGAPREEAKQENEWICEACGKVNPDTVQKCLACGSPRGNSKTAEYISENARRKNSQTADDDSSESSDRMNRSYRNTKIIVWSAVVFAALMLMWFFAPFFAKQDYTVTGFHWQSIVTEEKWESVEKTGDTYPEDAYNVEKHYRSSSDDTFWYSSNNGSDDSSDGDSGGSWSSGSDSSSDWSGDFSDNGDGTFSYSDKVYIPDLTQNASSMAGGNVYYTYSEYVWVPYKTFTAVGFDRNPYFNTDYTVEFQCRDTDKNVIYYVEAKSSSGTAKEIQTSQETWNALNVGDTITVQNGSIVSINGQKTK